MKSGFDSHSQYSGNLAIIILVFAVLGCVCPNSQSENRNMATPTPNMNSNSIAAGSPTRLPVASPTPADADLDSPEAQVHIAKGTQIYKRIAARTGLPVMFGWRAQKMSLLIPISDWNKMTKDDQINLTYYAENLVREI